MVQPTDPLVAANRFGLGPRPGELARIAADPRGHVEAQLADPTAARLTAPDLMASDRAMRASRAAERVRQAERARVAEAGSAAGGKAPPGPSPAAVPAMNRNPAPAMAAGPAPAMMADGKPAAAAKPALPIEAEIFRQEQIARLTRFCDTATPLLERLVLFWSNHFAVSETKGNPVRVTVGAMEREAIRPHVLGRFADMLKAVETHPAMLVYLDNNQSVGPQSLNGRNSKRGLNENLAREIMELHTLGVAGGYAQADVTALARVLTGWTVANPDEDDFHGGRFAFAPGRHEPGTHRVVGRDYPESGHVQGLAVLDDLARHPATARHLAFKLTRHFVDDQPPADLVERLARVWRDSDGDLAAVTRALVTAPEAWHAKAGKLRAPIEFVVAMQRAIGRPADVGVANGALVALGQPTWAPPGPDGWSDEAAAWASPAGLSTRLDLAVQFARHAGDREPAGLAADLWGAALPEATRVAIRRAESRQQAIALLFASPEFQRR
ncbi:DUF1800 domain-containing protein [Prosthecodimorpha staleyi]|uniref:DUF1800 domain-containing protein n=1 Tax=Prosthecodimorpha staleyi TaxID=2840188 RepID=A0A947D440_9HYPH|nr:DUF1800 domain-containing protein [Prosthecodimorpha staleyi]MBT9289211.1 DUF1800 domain-containing protein [Prosthecodimorpha staleyi]